MRNKRILLDTSALYSVQREALKLSRNKPGFAFFMEMGLGKTRVVLFEFNQLAEDGMCDFLVVISPNTLLGNWADEVEEIGLPYKVYYIGKNAKQDAATIKEMSKSKEPSILIMNFEIVPGRGIEMIKALMRLGRVYLGIDESIRLKSKDSVVAKTIYDEFKGAKGNGHFRRILSGRPAPQGPHDLWNQFRVIGAMEGTGYFQFRNTYCKMGGWMGKKVVGAINLDILRQRTGKYAFRAKKIDWTDLPTKLPAVTREIEMIPRQRQAYLTMMHDFVTEWGDQHISVGMAVNAKAKLAQIGTGFMYDNEGQVIWLMEFAENPKLKDLQDFIDSVETKIIIPYHHRPSLEALKWLGDKNAEEWKYAVLESGMDPEDIEFQKALFNTDPAYKVIFIQSTSHKYGHTLLGIQEDGPNHMPCHTMYFFENTYNLDTRLQTEDRDHRHGQRFPCGYYDVAISREDRLTIKSLQKKERMEEALLREITGVGDATA